MSGCQPLGITLQATLKFTSATYRIPTCTYTRQPTACHLGPPPLLTTAQATGCGDAHPYWPLLILKHR